MILLMMLIISIILVPYWFAYSNFGLRPNYTFGFYTKSKGAKLDSKIMLTCSIIKNLLGTI